MNEKVDVVEIMKEIEKKALERRKNADIKFLEEIDIRKFKGKGGFNDAISLSDSSDFLISSKLKLRKVSKKGFLTKPINFALRKFYFALRYLLDGVLLSQEKFNEKVNNFLEPEGLDFNYSAFEKKFRGDGEVLKKRFEKYLRFFENKNAVLDLACGRGVFLELLTEKNIPSVGVDIEESFTTALKNKGFTVFNDDAINFLKNSKDSFGGVFSSQFAEHLSVRKLNLLINLVFEKITEGSFFVMETINVKSLSVFSNSVFKDPSHVSPIHPDFLIFLFEEAGFKDVSLIFSSEFNDDEKLKEIVEKDENDKISNENLRKLNELLFAAQDYAVVGKK
jgi:SAM-dependent methyltransferase